VALWRFAAALGLLALVATFVYQRVRARALRLVGLSVYLEVSLALARADLPLLPAEVLNLLLAVTQL